jgi:hypothetical protein
MDHRKSRIVSYGLVSVESFIPIPNDLEHPHAGKRKGWVGQTLFYFLGHPRDETREYNRGLSTAPSQPHRAFHFSSHKP